MGIYIPGMEMPIAGMSIEIAENVNGKVYARLGYGLDDWHEVISVPEHGRLVDADDTIVLLRSLGSRDYRREQGTIQDAIKMLSSDLYTPTVIPKEEP